MIYNMYQTKVLFLQKSWYQNKYIITVFFELKMQRTFSQVSDGNIFLRENMGSPWRDSGRTKEIDAGVCSMQILFFPKRQLLFAETVVVRKWKMCKGVRFEFLMYWTSAIWIPWSKSLKDSLGAVSVNCKRKPLLAKQTVVKLPKIIFKLKFLRR